MPPGFEFKLNRVAMTDQTYTQPQKFPVHGFAEPRVHAVNVQKCAALRDPIPEARRRPRSTVNLVRAMTYGPARSPCTVPLALAGQVQFHPYKKRGRTKHVLDPLVSLFSTLLTMPLSQRKRHLAVFLLSLLPIASFELWPQQWGRFFALEPAANFTSTIPESRPQ